MKKTLLILLLITSFQDIFAQYPAYFTYDDQNNLPSNEVYSILQDEKGFIWLGCDAGLYKFDGVRYISYKSHTQSSKSVTNLVLSKSDKIYCVNFHDQIFYFENDTLKEIKHSLKKISDIGIDNNEYLYATHANGISIFDTQLKQWNEVENIHDITRSINVSTRNEVYFLTKRGVSKIHKGQTENINLNNEQNNFTPNYLLTCHKDEVWVFSKIDQTHFLLKNQLVHKNVSQNLSRLLQNRKVTRVKSLGDGNIWITTYNGIIRYNPQIDVAQIFYPELSFSDAIIDYEGNYWLTTLQAGMLRIPDLDYVVWNNSNENIKNDKLTHLATDGTHIFFSSVNGHIGQLNIKTEQLQTFLTRNNADIESFDFDLTDKKLYFHSQNSNYTFSNGVIENSPFQVSAVKSLLHVSPFYFLASSQGMYVKSGSFIEKVNDTWCRELLFDSLQNQLWVASNKGLLRFAYQRNHWVCSDTLFRHTQLLSISYDKEKRRVIALTFDGKVYGVKQNIEIETLVQLPENIQGGRLVFSKGYIYLATNKGVYIFDTNQSAYTIFNHMAGLASDNVQDLLVIGNVLWLATGKGLQKIQIEKKMERPLAKVYLKNLKADIELNYGEPLTLYPEASIYSASGNFQYDYRINNNDWIKLPASIEKIEIQNLPLGKFDIQVKVTDHLGRDSENIVSVYGFVQPPFWKSWWFVLVSILMVAFFIFLAVKRIIEDIRQREYDKNELLNSQLKAIRAQMNPHFMYNTLNSIQDLILQQDVKSTNYYLSRFSLLMRQILTFSEEEKILLSEETEMLKNYLELEKLRFGEDFSFRLTVDESIDSHRTYIPGLIVQPFVENALKHGLLHKKGEKKLDINFSTISNSLEILIQDNGVGRRRSAEIKSRSGLKHKSFASKAVQRRIELLNKAGKHQIEISVKDVWESEENTGTSVLVRIIN